MSARAFSRYAGNKIAQTTEEKAYRDYISECLRMLTETNANIGNGPYMKARLFDLLHPKPQETRTGAEIKSHILNKLKGG